MPAHWDEPTPSGHVYKTPTTYHELCRRHADAAQARIESWDDAECPPDPTWEMLGLCHNEIARLQEELIECQNPGIDMDEVRRTRGTG